MRIHSGGQNWVNNSGWAKITDPCDWYGLTCSDSYVTRIILPSNNLTGPFEKGLNCFTAAQAANIKSIYVKYNYLTGPVPTLAAFTSLQMLTLDVSFFVQSHSILLFFTPFQPYIKTPLLILLLSLNHLPNSLPFTHF